jgi:hypothetical protein
MNKTTLLDLAERAGWTFVQAVAGSVAAAGTATTIGTFDWRAALVGGAVAAVLSVLKVLGVQASVVAVLGKLPGVPAVVKDAETAAAQPTSVSTAAGK